MRVDREASHTQAEDMRRLRPWKTTEFTWTHRPHQSLGTQGSDGKCICWSATGPCLESGHSVPALLTPPANAAPDFKRTRFQVHGCYGGTRLLRSTAVAFQNAIIGHGPRNDLGRACSQLGLLRLRMGIRPFRTPSRQHYRGNDEEFCSAQGQGIHVSRLH
jgi:hypothetical protein